MGTGKSACATQGFGPTLPKGWGTRKTGTTIGARGKNKWAQARVPVPLKDSDPPFRKGGAPEKPAPQSALEVKANGHRQECLCHSRIRTHPSERVGHPKNRRHNRRSKQKQMGTGKSACATQGCGPTLPKGWGTRKIGATIGARGKSKWAQARVPVPLNV